MKNICVFCGSNAGANTLYAEQAAAFGRLLVANNLRLIYGGGKVGLMGIIADAVMDAGGEVIGVIPDFLMQKEVGHQKITQQIVVETMHERKQKMADLADAFVAMPGGIGTLEELFEVFTWGQLALHQKPIGLLNIAEYYNALLQFLDHTVKERFLSQANRDMIMMHAKGDNLLQLLKNYKAPSAEKWLDAALT